MIEGISKKFSVGSSVVDVGRFTYGVEHIKVRQWGGGSSPQNWAILFDS